MAFVQHDASQIESLMQFLKRKSDHIDALIAQLAQCNEVINWAKKCEILVQSLLKEVSAGNFEVPAATSRSESPAAPALPTPEPYVPPQRYIKPKVQTSLSNCFYLYRQTTVKYFVALGTGEDVPIFLRWTGKIRNRHLTKKGQRP